MNAARQEAFGLKLSPAQQLVGLGVLVVVMVLAYADSFVAIAKLWDTQSYRHGYLVPEFRVRAGTDQVQFRIVDPPFAASEPVGPPRALFVLGAFTVALGFGVATALVMLLLHPVPARTRLPVLNVSQRASMAS